MEPVLLDIDNMEDSRLEGDACRIIKTTESLMQKIQCSVESACMLMGVTLEEYRQAKDIYTKV